MSANDWKDQKSSAFKRGGAPKPFKRGGAPRPLSANIPDITKKTLGKRGLAEGGLITDWVRIVGPDLASSCQPERLAHPPRERSGGTLHIRVYGGAATELQHLEPLVLERINGHFGYRAVAKLRLIHAPLSGRSERVAEPKDSELPGFAKRRGIGHPSRHCRRSGTSRLAGPHWSRYHGPQRRRDTQVIATALISPHSPSYTYMILLAFLVV